MRIFLWQSLVVAATLFAFGASAQNSVSIGTTSVNPNAVLMLVGNGKQGLVLPIADHLKFTPTPNSDLGLMIYDSTDHTVYYWDGAAWKTIGGGVSYVSGSGITLTGNTISNSSPDKTVTIIGGGATTISGAYPDFSVSSTDNQSLSLTGTNLSIARGNALDLSSLNTDSQSLALSGTNLSIANGNSVNLSGIITDNQTLSLTGTNLSIARGNTLDLSSLNTDNQSLALTGTNLSIANGNTVDLSSISTDNQTLGLSGTSLSIARGNTIDLGGLNTDGQNLSLSGATGTTTPSEVFNLNISNAGGVTIKEGSNISISRNANELIFSASAGGTVNSVGLTMPSLFSISGSPVTSTGTLDVTLNNQSVNQFFAGPSSGTAGQPSFRSIVQSDLPEIDASKILDGSIKDADLSSSASISGSKVNPSFGAQNISTTGNASVSTLSVSGEINQSFTASANMIPYAYGSILSNGSISVSSGNISVTKPSTGTFDITVTGVSPTAGDIVVGSQFHFFTTTPGLVVSTIVSNKIRINTYDLTGSLVDIVHFSFVAYKP